MAGNLALHPAPGLGDLLPGFFAVPQNPMDLAQSGITRSQGIGDILPGSFVVPQNPIVNFTTGRVGLIGQQTGGPGQLNGKKVGGCGCGGGCGGCGSSHGMGQLTQVMSDLTAGNFTQALMTDTIGGFPTYVWVGGGLVLLYLLAGPSQGSSRVSRARRAYGAYHSNPRRSGRRRRRMSRR